MRGVWVLGVAVCAAAPVAAQEAGLTARTRLVDAVRIEQWEEALSAFEVLRREAPGAIDERLRLLAARACFQTDRLEACDALLGELLEGRGDHVEALFLRAQVRARQGDPGGARTLLLAGARAGQLVLRDMAAPRHRALFASLAEDSNFMLELMRASSHHQVSARTDLRDPFAVPDAAPPPRIEPDEGLAVGRALARRIEELLEQVARVAAGRDMEALLPAFTELRGLVEELDVLGIAELRRQVDRFRDRLRDHEDVYRSLRLQAAVLEGNQHLRAMAGDLRDARFDAVEERFAQLASLCQGMRAEGHPMFDRNGEQLFLRGKALAERARLLARIDALPLRVTGVVVPGAAAGARAIVNDRIVAPGSREVLDPDTGAALAGLEVLRVARSAVTFRYQGQEFVRPLLQRE